MKTIVKTLRKKILADTLTPVAIYLRLRDLFPYTILLESSDYQSSANSKSIICASSTIRFLVLNNQIIIESDGSREKESFHSREELLGKINLIISQASPVENQSAYNGFFGYTAYDAVRYFENINLQRSSQLGFDIPEMVYSAYRFVIVVDHFRNEIELLENLCENETSLLEGVISAIKNRNYPLYKFQLDGPEESYCAEENFQEMIRSGKRHCQRGDVFQVVLSRKYAQGFSGDDFNVYRALRSINPSPYLFYFDLGSFHLFGSSPEAQLTIENDKASIFPIAGTFRRNGEKEDDRIQAQKLQLDDKENAEHVMLVDLARNDLSRSGSNTRVEAFREIQFYSHVIHMVSKVSAILDPASDALEMMADTFPAGTLTGAPKIRAMELIAELERFPRGYYGGAIGFIGFNGDYNHAIMIRSFLSINNRLIYQAGAGIVAQSDPLSESEEVNNKLAALRQALKEAEKIIY